MSILDVEQSLTPVQYKQHRVFPREDFGDPPPTVGQKGEVSQKFANADEFAFGSEVGETAERMQGTFWINMFSKSICEQNLIS